MASCFGFASSSGDLQSQIQALVARIQYLQEQLAQMQGGSTAFCHTFSTNLSIGQSGDEITALQTALSKSGISILPNGSFDDQTASAVTGFQEKYTNDILVPNRLQHGTGYVGSATRKKLNALYGCENNIQPPTPTATPTSTATPAPQPPVSISNNGSKITIISAPTSVNVGQQVNFSFSATNPKNSTLGWNGISEGPGGGCGQPSGDKSTYTFCRSWNTPGSYLVKVDVSDNFNPVSGIFDPWSDSVSFVVNVGNVATSTHTTHITILSPLNDTFQSGQTVTISWYDDSQFAGKNTLYDVQILGDITKGQVGSTEIGSATVSIPTQMPNIRSITWTVPSSYSGTYKAYVSEQDPNNSTVKASATGPSFTITAPSVIQPSISVTSPNGGSYKVGDSLAINWTSSDYGLWGNKHVDINLLTHDPNGPARNAVATITSYLSHAGGYGWPIPSNISPGQYIVRVSSSETGEQVWGFSQPFTITASLSGVPSISAFSTASGPAGTQVTIIGTGFTASSNYVNFGGYGIPNLTSSNGTSITFTVPPVSPGVASVYVATNWGQSQPVNFTVTSN